MASSAAHGYMHLLALHEPVQVGGIDVYPNDLLHGDANGVTTIPRDSRGRTWPTPAPITPLPKQ